MYERFVCMYTCVPAVCRAPSEVRREDSVYLESRAVVTCLAGYWEREPRCSVKAVHARSHGATAQPLRPRWSRQAWRALKQACPGQCPGASV